MMEALPMWQHVSSERLRDPIQKVWSFPRKANWDNFSSPLAVSEVILQSVLWELCKLSRTHRVEIGNAVRITLQPWPERGESRVTDIQISREAFLVRKLLFIQTLLRFVANSNNTLPQL